MWPVFFCPLWKLVKKFIFFSSILECKIWVYSSSILSLGNSYCVAVEPASQVNFLNLFSPTFYFFFFFTIVSGKFLQPPPPMRGYRNRMTHCSVPVPHGPPGAFQGQWEGLEGAVQLREDPPSPWWRGIPKRQGDPEPHLTNHMAEEEEGEGQGGSKKSSQSSWLCLARRALSHHTDHRKWGCSSA